MSVTDGRERNAFFFCQLYVSPRYRSCKQLRGCLRIALIYTPRSPNGTVLNAVQWVSSSRAAAARPAGAPGNAQSVGGHSTSSSDVGGGPVGDTSRRLELSARCLL